MRTPTYLFSVISISGPSPTVAEKRTFGASSVRIVDGRELASEQPGGEHRDVLARDRQNMCHGSEKDGK
jgi:hypothetical protein